MVWLQSHFISITFVHLILCHKHITVLQELVIHISPFPTWPPLEFPLESSYTSCKPGYKRIQAVNMYCYHIISLYLSHIISNAWLTTPASSLMCSRTSGSGKSQQRGTDIVWVPGVKEEDLQVIPEVETNGHWQT